jgi:hypothetical protein
MASFWSAENAFAKFQVVAKVEALKFFLLIWSRSASNYSKQFLALLLILIPFFLP